MTRTHAARVIALALVAACSEPVATTVAPPTRVVVSPAAPAGTKYKLRFVTGVNPAGDGEM